MNNSKLLHLLKAMPRKDFLEFGRYLHCGFFTKDEHVLHLYDYLKLKSKKWNNKQLEKNYVAKKISTSKHDYDVRKLYHITSDLYLHLENYLIWKQTEENKALKKQLVLKAFSSYNLTKQYFQASQKFENQLKNRPFKDIKYYEQRLKIHHDRYIYPNQLEAAKKSEMLLETMESLELYYLSMALQYYIDLFSQKNALQIKTPLFVSIEQLLKMLKRVTATIETVPTIFQIKESLLLFLYQKDDVSYQQLKKLVFEYIPTAHSTEQYQCLNTLLNYTINTSRKGLNYIEERFEIYQFALNHDILLENSQLHPAHLLNILDTALALEKFDWSKQFIDTYQLHINEIYRENTRQLASAQLNFAQGFFEKTIKDLHSVKFEALNYLVISKGILLRSYFELIVSGRKDYQISFESLVSSYKILLKRRSLESEKLYQANINFVEFVNLLHINRTSSQYTNTQIIEKLETTQPIAYKSWLNKKVNRGAIFSTSIS